MSVSSDGKTGTAAAPAVEKSAPSPIVVDLGRQKAKAVKRLRKGEGKLLDDVNSTINELRVAGTIAATAQAVIVVVREKPRKNVLSMLKM